jgi:putative (di)nucleoside polyphosphate hydrolase
MTASDERPYRRNVGIALFNAEGLVFAGQPIASGPETLISGEEWQMPQGGLDGDHDIVNAARRELFEETGVRSAKLLAVTQDWWRYEFPPYAGPPHKLSRFRGQEQRWVAFRFEGAETEIDIETPGGGEPAEFYAWRWMKLAALPDLVMTYKRDVYRRVAEAFCGFAAP